MTNGSCLVFYFQVSNIRPLMWAHGQKLEPFQASTGLLKHCHFWVTLRPLSGIHIHIFAYLRFFFTMKGQGLNVIVPFLSQYPSCGRIYAEEKSGMGRESVLTHNGHHGQPTFAH